MGLEIKSTDTGIGYDMTPLQKKRADIEAQLAKLRTDQDTDAEAIEVQRLEDDLEFAKAQKAAPANERIGRVWFGSGRQVLFRQSFKREIQAIVKASEDVPGQPPKTEAQRRSAEQIAGTTMVRACIKSPPCTTIDEWETRYPNIWGDITIALNEHNSSFERDRFSK